MSEIELPSVPDDLAELFAPDLRAGEVLLWAGRPRPLRAARAGCSTLVPGLFFGGFATIWITASFAMTRLSGQADKDAMAFWFPFFGIPFLLVGLGMVSTPFWYARTAARSAFAVTDQRLLTRTPQSGGAVRVASMPAHRVGEITRSEFGDGGGMLEFALKDTPHDTEGEVMLFTDIDNVLAVQRLIRRELLKETLS